MSCQSAVYQWTEEVTRHLPHLSKPQAAVLALWSGRMVLARSCWSVRWKSLSRPYEDRQWIITISKFAGRRKNSRG